MLTYIENQEDLGLSLKQRLTSIDPNDLVAGVAANLDNFDLVNAATPSAPRLGNQLSL